MAYGVKLPFLKFYVFCLHVCLCNMYIQYPWRPEEGVGNRDGHQLQCKCWDLISDPLQAHPGLLASELSLHHPNCLFLKTGSLVTWNSVVSVL